MSDTHLGEVTPAFEAIVERYFSDCDFLLHAGDFVSKAVYEYLKQFMKGRFKGVRGNMDFGDLARVLSPKAVVELQGVKIGLVHGWGAPQGIEDRIAGLFRDEGVRCIVYGHTHNGANLIKGETLFFNPGSPTDTVYARVNTVGYLEIEEGRISGRLIEIS